MSLSGVILAGGKSSRMGVDKALLPFKEYSSLAEYQYRKLQEIFDNVYISTKENKFDFKANLIYDKYQNSNPLNAIISALEFTKGDIFLISVDMPLISKDTIKKLVDSYTNNKGYDIYIAKSLNGIEPTVAIYKQSLLNRAIEQYRCNNYKLMSLIKSLNYYEVKFNNLDEFKNLNTPQDYQDVIFLNKK
jgi:molybdopterin-guanine dinucleotide biosynthesis protein A